MFQDFETKNRLTTVLILPKMSGWSDDEGDKKPVIVKSEPAASSSGWNDDDGWGSTSTTTTKSTTAAAAPDDAWGAGEDWGSSSNNNSSNRSNSHSNNNSFGSRPSISAQSMNKGWSVSGGKRESTDGGSRGGDHSAMNGGSKGGSSNPSKLSIPGQIFVDKLSVDVTITDLRSTFGRFGKITRVTVDYKFDDDKAFAWLSYENELSIEVITFLDWRLISLITSMQRAITATNGRKLKNREIAVSKNAYVESSSSSGGGGTTDSWGSGGGDSWGSSDRGGRGGGRGGGGGGGGRACFKCGKEGHMSRECPDAGSSGGGRGGRGGGGGGRACFKCGQEGHMSRECPNGDSGGGASRYELNLLFYSVEVTSK